MNAALTLSYLLSEEEKKYRFLKVCFLLQVIGLLATFSRTVFISLVLVALYLLTYFKKKRLLVIVLLLIVFTSGIIFSSS